MTHYKTLGVHPDASAHAIKIAYRRLVKIHHPDRNKNDSERAKEKILKINEAYAVLSKPDKRRAYDQSLVQKPPPPDWNHPTARPAASANSEPQATPPGGEFATRLRADFANRFEYKDAFLALVFCFFLMMLAPKSVLANFGQMIVAWPFFAAAIIAGLAARFFTAIYISSRFKGGASSLGTIAISNIAAAIAMGTMAHFIEEALHQKLFSYPIVPALMSAVVPGALGAGFGRAFNRTIGAEAGVVCGALVGVITAIGFALWCVVFQIVAVGPAIHGSNSEALAKPLKAVLISAAMAGALGSFRMQRMFLFSVFDWVEGWFERFRPESDSEAKSIVSR